MMTFYSPCAIVKCLEQVEEIQSEPGVFENKCKSCDEYVCGKHFDKKRKLCTDCATCHVCKEPTDSPVSLYRGLDWLQVDSDHVACLHRAKAEGYTDNSREAAVA